MLMTAVNMPLEGGAKSIASDEPLPGMMLVTGSDATLNAPAPLPVILTTGAPFRISGALPVLEIVKMVRVVVPAVLTEPKMVPSLTEGLESPSVMKVPLPFIIMVGAVEVATKVRP